MDSREKMLAIANNIIGHNIILIHKLLKAPKKKKYMGEKMDFSSRKRSRFF